MIVLFAALRAALHSKKIEEKVKPLSLHIGLFVFIFVYAFAGGLLFSYIERSEIAKQEAESQRLQHECVLQKLETTDANGINAGVRANRTAAAIADCFRQEVDIRSQWGYVTGTLFGFGIITTLGYNRIAPISLEGRLLCVVYGLIGIPITLILIASIGQFVGGLANVVKKKAIHFKFLSINFNRQSSKTKLDEEAAGGKTAAEDEDEEETSTGIVGLALLGGFLLYIAAGALLLPALNGEFDFLNGIYYNFLCLTAIDFGALVPKNVEFLPITFLYVCVGLAITTIAIDIGSEYMRKLHHLGQRLKNVATTKIRFGGETLKVRDLLHSVGHKCGVDPSLIDNLDLENIVERAVAIREGREPPPDTNEDFDPPREPSPPHLEEPEKPPSPDRDVEKEPLLVRNSPELPLKKSVVATISNFLERTPSIEMLPPPPPPFDLCNFVAIDVDLPDDQELRERVNEFEESVVIGRPLEETVAAHIEMPREAPPPLIQRDSEPIKQSAEKSGEDEPKAFLEKKQKYGRDAKKLYDTYKEEWAPGQKRLGSRRRSVLSPPNEKNGATKSANASRVTSPARDSPPSHKPASRGPSPMPGASTSTPLRRASLLPTSPRASPRASPMSSPKAIRSPSKGAVAAAKEALERRLSANLNSSPLPGKRFF
ncbi:TWiK family of potassium channels protein 7 [Aphelenchoides fujianensis]|nr:TWiK family of potassium channels protein 7 [Aphelenchoides fujianensis]